MDTKKFFGILCLMAFTQSLVALHVAIHNVDPKESFQFDLVWEGKSGNLTALGAGKKSKVYSVRGLVGLVIRYADNVCYYYDLKSDGLKSAGDITIDVQSNYPIIHITGYTENRVKNMIHKIKSDERKRDNVDFWIEALPCHMVQ